MLTETWYANDSNVFHLPFYFTFCQNRTGSRGGGVSLLIRKYLECEQMYNYSCVTPDYETLCVLINCTLISVVYRPPNGNHHNLFQYLESLFIFASGNNYEVILGGDFNINMLADTSTSREFHQLISMFGYRNMILTPTRTTLTSASLIDLFITNMHTSEMKAGVIATDVSDHNGIYLCVRKQISVRHNCASWVFQEISPQNLDTFRAEVEKFDWNDIFQKSDAESAYDWFLDSFLTIYNQCFPFKTQKRSKKIRKPWITPELLTKIRAKDRLYKRFLKTRDTNTFKEFKSLRNKLTKELKKSKEKYWCDYFSSSSNTSITWKKLNTVLNRSCPNNAPTKIRCQGQELSGVNLANAFNDYFVGIDRDNFGSNALDFIENSTVRTCFLNPVTDVEVASVFLCLNNSTSCDADGIQIKPVKYVLDLVVQYIAYVFNLCLSQGVFPTRMQVAKVTILYKKGDRNEMANYRPVSILPVFSKGLEKIILSRLCHFSEKHSVINNEQFGFRKHRSTELALLEQKEFILNAFEDKQLALGVYVDFTKAFDYLNHALLLQKMERYGFRGKTLQLLKSYLGSRKQFVCVNGHSSERKQILSGVPQGSILGPFLFNVYVNDIMNTDKKTKFVVYADDTTLLFSAKTETELFTKANFTLHHLHKWSQLNALKINTVKTKAILFRPKAKNINIGGQLSLNNSTIEIVPALKTLGVYFTENMSWDMHVNHIASKLASIVGVTYANKKNLPTKVKLLIYNALFYSRINYCHLVWGNTTISNLQKIHLLQKKMLRNIFGVPYDHPSEPLFFKSGIMRIQSLYSYRLGSSYKLDVKNNTNFLAHLACLVNTNPVYMTRKPKTWKIYHCRTGYGEQMLKRTLPQLLNFCSKNQVCLEIMTKTALKAFFTEGHMNLGDHPNIRH